jgi:hypothetical protein
MQIDEKKKRPEETGTDTADMGGATLGSYVNPYEGQIMELYKGISERKPFQYDLNEDAMYQNLRDQYIAGGQMAMIDTMGQAAQLTGGYGNSYAQGAGQQAYQSYLQGLNDQIPDLYNMALQNYIQTGDTMLQQYGMLQDMAADDYGKWTDQRNYDYMVETDKRDYDYKVETDKRDYDYKVETDKRDHDYMVQQDHMDREYRDQMDARNMVLQMLELGKRPSDELMAAAGLNMEYVNALYPQQPAGGAGSNGDIYINMNTKWWEDTINQGGEGWLASGDGRKWQNSAQGREWIADTLLPSVIQNGGYDAGGLKSSGFSDAAIKYLDDLYKNSGG